mgnify:CR=1 FL=1
MRLGRDVDLARLRHDHDAVFLGMGLGGVNALRLAVTHPERVSHLITMGAPANRSPKLFGAGDGPTEGLKMLIEAYRTPTAEATRFARPRGMTYASIPASPSTKSTTSTTARPPPNRKNVAPRANQLT